MGSIGSWMSPSVRMTAASGIGRPLATWLSCARSPSTSSVTAEQPRSACGRVASRLPGMMSTCCLYWLDDFMRRPCVKPRHCFVVEDGSETAQVHGRGRVPLKALLSHDGRHRVVRKKLLVVFQDKQIVSRDPTVGRKHHAYVNELQVPEHLVHPVGLETNDALATELEAVGLLQWTKTIRTVVEFSTARESESLAFEHRCREI